MKSQTVYIGRIAIHLLHLAYALQYILDCLFVSFVDGVPLFSVHGFL